VIRPGSRERSLRVALVVAGDFLAAWGALAAVVAVRRTVELPFTRRLLAPGSFVLDARNILLFGGALAAALALSGFYRLRVMSRARPIVMVALLIQVALVSIGAAILESPLPRSLLFAVPLFEAVLLQLWRSLQQLLWPVRRRDTLLVGDPAAIAAAHAVLARASDRRIQVIGYAGSARMTGTIEDELPWLGTLDDPAVRTAIRDVEEVIYVGSDSGPDGRLDLLRIRGPRGYLLLASPADALLMSSMLGWMGDEPLIEISIGCGYGFRAIVKRAIDVAGAATLIILSFPLWLAVSAAIAIDSGRPLFLRQPRRGLGGVSFRMWKFRSMRARSGVDGDDTDGARVTRVGRFLRRYRLDELPQLLNVLTGDMSLVGPRPEQPEIAERILADVPDFDLRCMVRPGIAGLAQILAEYDSRPAVKLRYDLTYMCSWSVWLDVRLLFSSVAAALSGSGI
jgi:lipopolysaccharide/colanic/teichoic acid biosynthesis glycosyltransferase